MTFYEDTFSRAHTVHAPDKSQFSTLNPEPQTKSKPLTRARLNRYSFFFDKKNE
jgi:hypothetical protein